MSQLVIEYVFEGHQRGYNFTSPTRGYDDQTLKAIWRSAMPRGQGWGTEAYTGARSIKCFPLPDDMIAVSEVTVTDLVDEGGRRGIRRAVVDVMTPALFVHHIQSRLAGYPAEVQAAAEQHHKRCLRKLSRLKRNTPLILSYPFTTMQDWWAIEVLVLRLASMPTGAQRQWGMVTPFTTLALDYHNESKIIALPAARAAQINSVPVIDLGN